MVSLVGLAANMTTSGRLGKRKKKKGMDTNVILYTNLKLDKIGHFTRRPELSPFSAQYLGTEGQGRDLPEIPCWLKQP